MSNRGKRSVVVALAITVLSGVPAAPARAVILVAGVCELTLSTGTQALVPSTAVPKVERTWHVGGGGSCDVWEAGDEEPTSSPASLTLTLTAVVGTGCFVAVGVGTGTFELTHEGFPASIVVTGVALASGVLVVGTAAAVDRFAGAGVFKPDTALSCTPGPTSMAWTGPFLFGKVDPPLLAAAE